MRSAATASIHSAVDVDGLATPGHHWVCPRRASEWDRISTAAHSVSPTAFGAIVAAGNPGVAYTTACTAFLQQHYTL